MGSSASKPVRSAANTVSRRQYPKKPTPATAAPSAAKVAAQPQSRAPPQTQAEQPPQQPPGRDPQASSQGPVYHSNEKASPDKSSAIDLDGRDPHFAASLRTIGPVNPAPTYSHSSTFNPTPSTTPQSNQATQSVFPQTSSNPALLVLDARERIARAAEREAEQVGRPNFAGREFLDALTIRQVMSMRDRQGLSPEEIESTLRLKRGVVERLGKRGIVSEV